MSETHSNPYAKQCQILFDTLNSEYPFPALASKIYLFSTWCHQLPSWHWHLPISLENTIYKFIFCSMPMTENCVLNQCGKKCLALHKRGIWEYLVRLLKPENLVILILICTWNLVLWMKVKLFHITGCAILSIAIWNSSFYSSSFTFKVRHLIIFAKSASFIVYEF